ncbi:unnamed protein product, partial [marine sediment metagenome]
TRKRSEVSSEAMERIKKTAEAMRKVSREVKGE